MTNTAIASTQQAGQGDAVILGNNSQPAGNTLLQIGARKQQQNAQEKLLNQKQKQDNATKFYQNLAGLKERIWDADLGRATEKVNELVNKAIDYQKKGINPFDPQNMGAYMDLYGDVEKLQLFQEASKSAEQQYLKGYTSINNDKLGVFDHNKSITALESYKNYEPLERAKLTIDLPLAPYNSIALTDKTLGDTMNLITQNAKVLNDAGLVADANDAVLKNKPAFMESALGLHQTAIQQGRITPEQVLKDASDYFDANIKKALYDPTKDEDQAFAKAKQADLNADRARRFKLASEKFQFAKSLQEIKSTEVDDLFKSISEGLPVSSMALANQTIQNPKTGELVITGAFTPIKNKNNEVVGVNIETFKEVEENGVKKIVKQGNITSPILDSKKNPVYSTTQIYKSAFATSSKNKAPVTNYTVNETGDFELIEKDQKQVGAKQTQSEKTSKSTTKVDNGGTVTYSINGKTGTIPKSQEAAFKKKYPNAKKM
jgi:hypothetical protein